MDLVPDNVGRDNSGAEAFPLRSSISGTGRDAAPLNGAAHRAVPPPSEPQGTVEEMTARAVSDPTISAHPLVQGLLIELPERDGALPEGWLDRWLEAARAVMELLYTQRPSHPAS